MSYKINGTELTLQPTTGRWLPRKPHGIDGRGTAVYPGVREYELTFVLSSPSEYNQLQTFFEGITPTGTAVVDLPLYGHTSYTFFSYTGCVLREPEASAYFRENQTKVKLLIANIRT
jgi:hypothetical protein